MEAWAPERPLIFGTKRKLEEKIVTRNGTRGTAIIVTAEEMIETVAGKTTEMAVTKTAMTPMTSTVEDTTTGIERLQRRSNTRTDSRTHELTTASVPFHTRWRMGNNDVLARWRVFAKFFEQRGAHC